MGNLIAVGNLKGGTGKSTIAVNLACALADEGGSVVLVDADAPAPADDGPPAPRPRVPDAALPPGGARDAQRWVARVIRLKAAADHVVVDLPPQVGSGIASALLIADLFVIPVTPSGVDLRATGKALDLLRRARAVRGATKPACMLVPSRVDRRTAVGRGIHATLERFGLKVGPAVRQRSAHVEAFGAGAWIGAHAPGSPGHREIRVLKDRILELLAEGAPRPARELQALRPAYGGPALGDAPTPALPPPAGRTIFGRLGA